MTQPLSGLLVLDFSTLLPGPLATLLLAEAGAEVVKVERPDGEEMRFYPPSFDGISAGFAVLNRGKQSLALDLKAPGAKAKLAPWIEEADILVEQFRPGVMDRLGLGYEAVKAINPRIVYCSISGYGADGPRSGEAGHDLNYVARTGLLALATGPADQPQVPPALIADIGGGTLPAVINILLGLRQRDLTGEGCHIDIAMTDAMFTFAWYAHAIGHATGRFPGNGEMHLAGASPRYQLYPTKDGRLVACAALEQKFWNAFTAAIGLPAESNKDLADPQGTKAAVAAIMAAETAAHWEPILAAADCCATLVTSLQDAQQDPHFVARGLFAHTLQGPSGKTMPALPVPIAPVFREAPGAKPVARPDRDD